MKKLIIIVLLVPVLLFQCKEEEYQKYIAVFPGIPIVRDDYNYNSFILLEGVQLKFYTNEVDYLLDQHVFHTAYTDEKGWYKLTEGGYSDSLWCRAVKDTLNNSRFRDIRMKNDLGGTATNISDAESVFAIRMSSSPTKLQLNITHNGSPVDSARVQLYMSYEQLINDIRPQENLHQTTEYVYGNWDQQGNDYIINKFTPLYLKISNFQGEVFFDNLEPRIYWFHIAKGTLSNTSGIIRTSDPLPDDENITTLLTINIQ